ncbi:MAG: hypothetical protein J1G06_05960 [Oscillospiraceae bacterium]|nr:hypothetical protein [Oscillospiraceae bacterium]
MNKKLVSILASAVLAVQAVAMPIIANAEASATYITDSDFLDCAVGGAVGKPLYGMGIILDGGPWLSKGSASEHYQTFYYDEENQTNYCNMYSNSLKGTDLSGSMYMYQRDTTQNFSQTYGYCQFDLRTRSGRFEISYGSFSDPTSNTNYKANSLTVDTNKIVAHDGSREVTVASIKPETWYTVKIVIDNKLQSNSISVTEKSTGKVVGMLEDAAYFQPECTKVCIWCFGYLRGSAYDYDLSHVTIAKTDEKTNPYSVK